MLPSIRDKVAVLCWLRIYLLEIVYFGVVEKIRVKFVYNKEYNNNGKDWV
jgi:hypothetical protein